MLNNNETNLILTQSSLNIYSCWPATILTCSMIKSYYRVKNVIVLNLSHPIIAPLTMLYYVTTTGFSYLLCSWRFSYEDGLYSL